MKRDIARELFRSYRIKNRKNSALDEDRTKKEDPEKLSNILSDLVTTRDWKKGIADEPFSRNGAKLLEMKSQIIANPSRSSREN